MKNLYPDNEGLKAYNSVKDIFDFCEKNVHATALERDARKAFDRQLWNRLTAAGLFDIVVSQDDSTHRFIQSVLAFSRFSQVSLDMPLVISVGAQIIASEIVRRFGSASQLNKYYGDISGGRSIAAMCNAETGAGTNLQGMRSEFALTSIAEQTGTLNIVKHSATNAGQAKVGICSVVNTSSGPKPVIEVVLVDLADHDQQELTASLAGFWTGLTGSISLTHENVRLDNFRVGREGAGLEILRFCYNLERLLLATAVSGYMKGLTDLALKHVHSPRASAVTLHDKQYIQEKVLELHMCATKLEYLVQGTLGKIKGWLPESLNQLQDPLAVMKLTIMDGGPRAVKAFHELFGVPAYKTDHLAQKGMRDFMALQFLGGTAEQQKIMLFNHLVKNSGL